MKTHTYSSYFWLAFSFLSLLNFTLLLWPEVEYRGFFRNDLSAHHHYVQILVDSFRSGSLGLEEWDKQTNLGLPIFRVYQNLSHYFAALVSFVFGFDSGQVIRWILFLCLILQHASFFFAARMIKWSIHEAIFCAFLSLMISSSYTFGHEFHSYVFNGYGLWTQIVGTPLFVMTLSMIISSGAMASGEKLRPFGLMVGFLIAITFLIHHFLGYILILCSFVVFSINIFIKNMNKPKYVFQWCLAGFVFCMVAAYQLKSLLEDSIILQRGLFDPPSKWNGVSTLDLIKTFLTGRLYDSGRFPVFSLLVVLGYFSVFFRRPSQLRILISLTLMGFILFCGKDILGSFISFIPGLDSMHLERWVYFIHVLHVFWASRGASFLCSFSAKKGLNAVGYFVLFIAMGFLVLNQSQYLLNNVRNIRVQESIPIGDRYLRDAHGELKKGNVWLFLDSKRKADLSVRAISLYDILYQMGYSSLNGRLQSMTYTSDSVGFFRPYIWHHFNIFNIRTVIGETKLKTAGSPFEKISSNGKLAVFKNSTVSSWGVIEIPRVELVQNSEEYLKALELWFLGEESKNNQYPILLPRNIFEHLGGPLPKSFGGGSGSVVKEGESRRNELYSEIVSEETGFGVLRTAYYPRWEFRVNGTVVPIFWVAPGFMAFPIEAGKNKVIARFKDDPLRKVLFQLMVILVLGFLVSRLLNFYPQSKLILAWLQE